MPREDEGAVVRQGRCIALVVAFLIGCVVLLVVGCAGARSESPKQQGHTEATREQTRSAKAASEGARCDETQLIDHNDTSLPIPPSNPSRHRMPYNNYEMNNVPGCPKGGPLLGTDSTDKLDGSDGDDKIRGLGAKDHLFGGQGSDVIYGGPGNDFLSGDTWDRKDRATSKDVLYGGPGNDELADSAGDDVLYGGDGNDVLYEARGEDVFYSGDGNDPFPGYADGQRDKIYCGAGKDEYVADKNDYVDSSCEKKVKWIDFGE